jgi:AhpD family alkylhydroperoxidase
MPFIAAALGPSAIDFRTKEIIVLRTSAIMSCSFCTNLHTVVAEQTGLTSEQLHALRGESAVENVGFSEKELCLIAWCDAMSNGTAPVPTELTKKLTDLYSQAEVVEFGMASGCTIMLNRYASALQLPTATPHLEWLENNGFAVCN